MSEIESGTKTRRFSSLAYGRAARVLLEILVDDEAVLPNSLPSNFNLDRYKQKQCTPASLVAAAQTKRKRIKGISLWRTRTLCVVGEFFSLNNLEHNETQQARHSGSWNPLKREEETWEKYWTQSSKNGKRRA